MNLSKYTTHCPSSEHDFPCYCHVIEKIGFYVRASKRKEIIKRLFNL
jgi:hypothetical protein